MKKQKLSYRIIRTMNEDQIKDVGIGRFTKRHNNAFYIGTIASAGSVLAGQAFLHEKVVIISVIPGLLFMVWWLLSSIKEGKRVLDFVKGKEQPIDLDLMD